jgi:hypothetical protein
MSGGPEIRTLHVPRIALRLTGLSPLAKTFWTLTALILAAALRRSEANAAAREALAGPRTSRPAGTSCGSAREEPGCAGAHRALQRALQRRLRRPLRRLPRGSAPAPPQNISWLLPRCNRAGRPVLLSSTKDPGKDWAPAKAVRRWSVTCGSPTVAPETSAVSRQILPRAIRLSA